MAREMGGDDVIVNRRFGMGAEDFAYMAQACAGNAMFNLGAKFPTAAATITDYFDIDEDVFPMETAVLAEAARRFVTGELA
ncbi:MAG: hypothetical protein R2851_03840 [Caldilineaceae bacterium]